MHVLQLNCYVCMEILENGYFDIHLTDWGPHYMCRCECCVVDLSHSPKK